MQPTQQSGQGDWTEHVNGVEQATVRLRVDGAGQDPVLVRRGEEEDVTLVRRCRCNSDILFRLARRRARRIEKAPLLPLTAGIDVEAAARTGSCQQREEMELGAGADRGTDPGSCSSKLSAVAVPGWPGGGLWHSGPGSPPLDTTQAVPLHSACAPPQVPSPAHMSSVGEQAKGS